MLSSRLLNQIDLCCLGSVNAAFLMGAVENIDMISIYTAAAVLCGVNCAVDHKPGSIGYDLGIHSCGMPGARKNAGACKPSPAAGAALAGTVARSGEYAQGRGSGRCIWALRGQGLGGRGEQDSEADARKDMSAFHVHFLL